MTTFTRSLHKTSMSVHKTLSQTYLLTFIGLLVSAVVSYLTLDVQFFATGFGLITTFIVAMILMFTTLAMSRRQSGIALVPAIAFMATMGAMMGPNINHYLGISPNIVLMAVVLTTVVTGLLSAIVIVFKRDFSNIGGFLFVGLLLLLVALIANIFIQSSVFHLVLSYIGALIFSGYILYDTSKIMTGEYDNYIEASIGMYLNIINLFQFILNILGFGDD